MFNFKNKLTLAILLGIFCLSAFYLTGCKKKTEPAQTVTTAVVDAGEQTLCPVMNAPINKELYTEYNGKKVYFCCPSCKETFLKNPEKYLDKLPQFKK